MAVRIDEVRFTEPLGERLASIDSGDAVVIHWLGQAGFVLSAAGGRVLIDPYLSDSLAEKYRGTATPHERVMPAPVDIDNLGPIDLVLVTHHHTDHMDPGTLVPLAAAWPQARFVVPAGSRDEALRRIGVDGDRLLPLDAGDRIEPIVGLRVEALRAAHETLERDDEGRHVFLGYALRFGTGPDNAVTIVHSGDTVPFEGQAAEIARLEPDLLLLPVNGRSAALQAKGIAGNLTLDEAVALTAEAGVGAVVAHHHGLFAFNTVPFAEIEAVAARPDLPVRLIPAREGLELRLTPA